MIVQHNLQAMNANRMLGITAGKVASSTEKLSSGYRVNRAADDAAGLAISEKMRKQIRGLDRASSNAEDGISCVQTTEGALAEVQDMLQRMNELCVQAANGTNSVTDRGYIQDEIDQLITEIDRVAETTKFNDTYLLKGDDNKKSTKSYTTDYIVANERNIVSNDPKNANALPYKVNYMGKDNVYMVKKEVLTATANEHIDTDTIRTGEDITDYMINDATAGNKVNASVNTTSYRAFVNAELNSAVNTTLDGSAAYDLGVDGADSTIRANRDLYIYDSFTDTVTHLHQGDEMTQYLYDDNTIKDVRYRLVEEAPATIWDDPNLQFSQKKQQLYDSDGKEVSAVKLNEFFDENGNYKGGLYTTSQAHAKDEVFASTSTKGYFTGAALIKDFITQFGTDVAGSLEFDLHVGADSDRENKIGVEINSLTAAGLGIQKLSSYYIGIVDETGDNATDAIDVVARALGFVSEQRAMLGAVQNRLEHTIKNLDNVVENTQAAESAIRDTDMADEMVQYSNGNVLQQAGQSMLAQANQANQGVLSLIQ